MVSCNKRGLCERDDNNLLCVEIVLLQTEIEQLEGLAVNMKSDLGELERGRVCTLCLNFTYTAITDRDIVMVGEK